MTGAFLQHPVEPSIVSIDSTWLDVLKVVLYLPYRHDDDVQRIEVLELVGVDLPDLSVLST